ncbi:MAG: hypothetical protein HRU40_16205, partial [Saprospiraceae bacterium]|nr:hypothetical protein [Saprospiraceae bacterium]
MYNAMRWVNLLLVLGTFLVYLSPYIPPHVFFPLVFPGLLFPWLILANALFFVFWLIVHDRYFLFSLGVIVLGFAEVSSIIGRPWGQLNHNDSNELTLVTFNMRRLEPFDNKQQVVSPDVLTEVLGSYNADIICLQEVPSTQKKQDKIRAAFARNLGMGFSSMSASKSL